MLVNAQKSISVQPTSRTDMDPTTAAAGALYSGMLQQAQNIVNPPAAPSSLQANSVADNVNAAFAKTRVLLQATPPTADVLPANGATASGAVAEFQAYMSKSPEQRLRDNILKDMGLTEEDLKNLPPERQMTINQEIAQRLQDKMQLAKEEKETQNSAQPINEKFLAAL